MSSVLDRYLENTNLRRRKSRGRHKVKDDNTAYNVHAEFKIQATKKSKRK